MLQPSPAPYALEQDREEQDGGWRRRLEASEGVPTELHTMLTDLLLPDDRRQRLMGPGPEEMVEIMTIMCELCVAYGHSGDAFAAGFISMVDLRMKAETSQVRTLRTSFASQITSAEVMDKGRSLWMEATVEQKTVIAQQIYPEVCVTGEQPALRRRKYDDDDV